MVNSRSIIRNGYNSGTILNSMLLTHSFTRCYNAFKIRYSLYEISGYNLAKNQLFKERLVINFLQLKCYTGAVLKFNL